jgi:hypothetical protein
MVHVDPIKRANISHDKDVGKVEDGWVGAKPKFKLRQRNKMPG